MNAKRRVQPVEIRRAHVNKYADLQKFKLKFLLIVAAMWVLYLLLGGCSTQAVERVEMAATFVHIVDTTQTLHIARTPECYHEAHPMTQALVGDHPSEGEVVAVMAAYTLVNESVSRWLKRRAQDPDASRWWSRASAAFAWSRLISSSYYVAQNHGRGLRPFGSGGCRAGGGIHWELADPQ